MHRMQPLAPRKPRQKLHLDTSIGAAAGTPPPQQTVQPPVPTHVHTSTHSDGTGNGYGNGNGSMSRTPQLKIPQQPGIPNHHSRDNSVHSLEEQEQEEFNAEVKASMSQDLASKGKFTSSGQVMNPNDQYFGHMTETTWLEAARCGRIEEQRQLGEGSGGSVRLCRLLDAREGTPHFALKEIPANPDPELRKQILRELQFNRLCDSPAIVRYYGAYLVEEVGSIFIAMEYCEGGSLDAILRQAQSRGGRIGERVLARIAESVLQGICYLYDRKIIHRDIKPQNILLTLAGEVKLCDFGVSGQVVNSLATTFTGTSYYMAPERIRGQPYTVTSDVWSLGLTLMELAQGRFPFHYPEGFALTPIELLSQIVNMPAPELQDEPGIKWSQSFRHFLKCCLEKDLAARPSPQTLLSHPWITGHRSRSVDMEKFVRQCWA